MVTRQLQVERRTAKERWPETDVLPLSHAVIYCSTLVEIYRVKYVVVNTAMFYLSIYSRHIACWLSTFILVCSQVGVLAVTMAYGFFRMFYLKMPEYASSVYVYALDVMSVIMTVVALAPAALRFATIGRVVGQLQTFVDCTRSTVCLIGEFDQLVSKAIRFIQEVEVIHRGFTLYVYCFTACELIIVLV